MEQDWFTNKAAFPVNSVGFDQTEVLNLLQVNKL